MEKALREDGIAGQQGAYGILGELDGADADAVVTAALGHVPPPLIEQLKVGGRLVMPLGAAQATQQLTVVEKAAAGETRMRSVMLVRFVPFTRSKGDSP